MEQPPLTEKKSEPKFRWRYVLLFLLVVIIGGVGAGFLFVQDKYTAHQASGPLTEEKIYQIQPGMGLSTIAALLEKEGIIEDRLAFRLIVEFQGLGNRLQAGNYLFPVGVSAAEVVHILSEGRTHQYRLTIPEGLSSYQILQILQDNDHLKGSLPNQLPEGSVHPETYHFEKDMSREELLKFMQESWQLKVDELWQTRSEDVPLDSKEEALTLASIIEREAVNPEEMPIIAGVFKNRLDQGMRLQSDPTVIYALSYGKGKIARKLLQKDWKYQHPYNTYVIKGLPPGPIGHPSALALEAALNPALHDYLFFVADGEGGHRFAVTYEEHKQNIKKLRAYQRENS